MVSPELGRLYPGHVIGVHLTGLLSLPPTNPADLAALPDAERARLDELKRFQRWRGWYATVQTTRPQTLAYALTDSPIGQLAWMVDVFKEFADTTDVLEDAIDRDQFLTNVSLYWLTKTAGSAARLFKETSRDLRQAPERSGVPTGVAVFPREPSVPIRTLAERSHHIVHWEEFERGGHFPAMEVPDLVVNDLREFFRALR
jgi:pimeloyl-ACP methyl ester carboxylesterase